MKPIYSHRWDLSPAEAEALQSTLANRVVSEDGFDNIERVAGVDVAYSKSNSILVAAIAVIDAETLELVESATSIRDTSPTYEPGLFSFRELPPLIDVFDKLKSAPGLVVCDAHGIAHPRRFGLACHLGLCFDIPSIGCAKSLLTGAASNPGAKRGSTSPIIDDGQIVGKCLRTQDDIRPVYVSIGHRVSLTTACEWVLKLSPTFRLPETTRASDHIARSVLRNASCQDPDSGG